MSERMEIDRRIKNATKSIFKFNQDIYHEISPFICCYRSYRYQTNKSLNGDNARNMKSEVKMIREIISMMEDYDYPKCFDVDAVVEKIAKFIGRNEDGSTLAAQSQMEKFTAWLSKKLNKEVTGYLFKERNPKPIFFTSDFEGAINIMVIRFNNEGYGTSSRMNVYCDHNYHYCITCCVQYHKRKNSKHISCCQQRCHHFQTLI
uniref:Uncharacterized protein n=1 Tax=Panagrolaimus sp. PS1159 TaxID=55785 RepID=A0AC35F6I9_9BILA